VCHFWNLLVINYFIRIIMNNKQALEKIQELQEEYRTLKA